MSAKAISEQTGKELLYKYICTTSAIQNRFKYARVTPDTDWARLLQDHPWLLSQVSPPRPPTPPLLQAQMSPQNK
jgi:ATP citrate (pro-S)-lyase